jgi:hypothetical protein
MGNGFSVESELMKTMLFGLLGALVGSELMKEVRVVGFDVAELEVVGFEDVELEVVGFDVVGLEVDGLEVADVGTIEV